MKWIYDYRVNKYYINGKTYHGVIQYNQKEDYWWYRLSKRFEPGVIVSSHDYENKECKNPTEAWEDFSWDCSKLGIELPEFRRYE